VTEAPRKALDAAERVVAVCDALAGLVPSDVDAFAADLRTQWAVEMGLIRIGEGVNRIPDEVLEVFCEQPWRQIIAMRNIAAHRSEEPTKSQVNDLGPTCARGELNQPGFTLGWLFPPV
jgi:uncharacterized protein with HEPN domain